MELTTEQWKQQKKKQRAIFTARQRLPYEVKIRRQEFRAWEFWMYRCCTDPKTGEKYGWGRVLDYIGMPWEDVPAVQLNLFDAMKMGWHEV